jgi:hypothetical protein
MKQYRWTILAFTCLSVLTGYLTWRAARDGDRANYWRLAVYGAVKENDSLRAATDSLLQRGADLGQELQAGEAEREYYREKSARLDRQVLALRDKVAKLPTIPPDTCLPWVNALTALADTLTAFGASEGARATLAEIGLQKSNAGRLEALAAVGLLSVRLQLADSLLKVAPKPLGGYVSLLLDGRIGSDGRLDGTAALRRGKLYAGIGWSSAPRVVVGWRTDLRIF